MLSDGRADEGPASHFSLTGLVCFTLPRCRSVAVEDSPVRQAEAVLSPHTTPVTSKEPERVRGLPGLQDSFSPTSRSPESRRELDRCYRGGQNASRRAFPPCSPHGCVEQTPGADAQSLTGQEGLFHRCPSAALSGQTLLLTLLLPSTKPLPIPGARQGIGPARMED